MWGGHAIFLDFSILPDPRILFNDHLNILVHVTMASGRPEHRGPPELVGDFIDVVQNCLYIPYCLVLQ